MLEWDHRVDPVRFYLWMQPGKQHGRRLPSFSSAQARLMWCARVSAFATEIVQQIHSLRARGVRLFQAGMEPAAVRASRRSLGRRCTGGLGVFLVMTE